MTDAEHAARSLVDRYWEQLLETEPLLGTMVGDERYDDRLPDPSERGRACRETLHRSALEELALIDRDLPDEGLRTTLDVLEAIATRGFALVEHRLDRLQVVRHLWGPGSLLGGPGSLLGELGSLQRADSPERLERYLARLAATDEFYGAVNEVVREGVSVGITAPRVVVERAIAQLERLIATDPGESPAVQPVPETDVEGRERVATVVRDVVVPALAAYLGELRAYLPSATETIGLLALPAGDAMYAAEILSWTSLPLEARKVHDLGVEELGPFA